MFEFQEILLICGLLVLAGMVILPVFFGAPWHPLLPGTIKRILRFADIRPGETICDLGCGEGRVLITSAKEFSTRAIGVEIDPLKVVRCAAQNASSAAALLLTAECAMVEETLLNK